MTLPPATQRPVRSRAWELLRFVGPALLFLGWATASGFGLIHPSVLPPPSAVLASFVSLVRDEHLVGQIGISLMRALSGAAIGITLGILFGTASGLWKLGEKLFDSLFQMLRTVPFLALVPLFIVWLGIGEFSKIMLIALATTFPTYLYAYSGVRGVDPKIIEAMENFGLTGPNLVREVVLPLALPSILSGVRLALSISVLVLIAAEQINASAGIGYLLNNAQNFQRVDEILVCILIYACLGLAADLVVRVLERWLLPWRPRSAAR